MANFLTDGRTALLRALQDDPTLSARVRTWFTWGPGLRHRYAIEPANCPLLSLVPAELDQEQLSNAAERFPQDVQIGIATDGQDAEPCEELVAAALGVVDRANQYSDLLGLSSEGLAQVVPVSITWRAVPDEQGARIQWHALLMARMIWLRR